MATNLPLDIWHLICLHLEVGEYRHRDLFNLCLVSKRTCSVAQPLLYSKFYRWEERTLIPFATTCLQRPDLAACVGDFILSTLQVSTELCDEKFVFRPGSGLDPAKLAAACPKSFAVTTEAVSRLVNFEPGCSMAGGRNGEHKPYHDASELFSVLLLAHLPSLRCLTILTDGFDVLSWISKRLKQDPDNPEFLPSLTQVNIHYSRYQTGFPLCDATAIWALPTINALQIFQASGFGEGFTFPITTSIKSLRFFASVLTSDQLRDIIQACPLLEEFGYHSAGDFSGPQFDELLGPQDVIDGLAPVKMQLKDLQLNFGAYPRASRAQSPATTIQTFEEFVQLETLKIDDSIYRDNTLMLAKQNFDRLARSFPPGLRRLGIFFKDLEWIELIDPVGDLLAGNSHLRHLELVGSFHHSLVDDDYFEHLVYQLLADGEYGLVPLLNAAGVTVTCRLISDDHTESWFDRLESRWNDAGDDCDLKRVFAPDRRVEDL